MEDPHQVHQKCCPWEDGIGVGSGNIKRINKQSEPDDNSEL